MQGILDEGMLQQFFAFGSVMLPVPLKVCIDAERRELQRLTECLRELTLICETENEQHCTSLWSKI